MDVSDAELDRAAGILQRGGLVAFPTETVYGLGANALDRDAVLRIYAAKGRPATSPLIVHVSDFEMVAKVASEWPEKAQRLADRFWPGALTLVVKKSASVPDEVTAGLDTVGIRMPAHPVTNKLIRRAGIPLAAPSANRFMQISPTTAEHVRASLGDRVEMILDGGAAQVGIESTVLSVAEEPPVLLRPGMISRAAIESVIGPVRLVEERQTGSAHPSPGLHHRHYAPRTPLFVMEKGDALPPGRGKVLTMPCEAEQFAASLYAALHAADAEGWEWIALDAPPRTAEWAAVWDRLLRASARD